MTHLLQILSVVLVALVGVLALVDNRLAERVEASVAICTLVGLALGLLWLVVYIVRTAGA